MMSAISANTNASGNQRSHQSASATPARASGASEVVALPPFVERGGAGALLLVSFMENYVLVSRV